MFQFRPNPIVYTDFIEFQTLHIEARDQLPKSVLKYDAEACCRDDFPLYDHDDDITVKSTGDPELAQGLKGKGKNDGPSFFDEPVLSVEQTEKMKKAAKYAQNNEPDLGNCWLLLNGCTERGESVTCYVPYMPYVFIEIPEKWEESKECYKFVRWLETRVHLATKQLKHSLQWHKKLFGWIPNEKDITQVRTFPFLKVEFPTVRSFKAAANAVRYIPDWIKKGFDNVPNDFKFIVWESDADIVTKFFDATKNIASGWVIIKDFRHCKEKRSHDQIEIEVAHHGSICALPDKHMMAPVVILSTDEECYSSTGAFPNAKILGDPVITFGNCIQIFGRPKEECRYVIFTLGACASFEELKLSKEEYPDPSKYLIVPCQTEHELLCKWRDLVVVHANADIITGYNLLKFDWPYADDRMKTLISDYKEKTGKKLRSRFYYLSKFIQDYVPLVEANFASSAFGSKEAKAFKMTGRLVIDMYDYYKKQPEKFSDYSLDFMASKYLKLNKIDLDKKKMFKLWKEHGAIGNAEIAWYCAKDCYLPIRLLDFHNIIVNTVEMSRHTHTILAKIIDSGQQIKGFNKILLKCHLKGYILTKSLEKPSEADYEGATVIEPKPGFYQMILTLDFSSLYPSIMISHNLSYDTLILDSSIITKHNLQKGLDYNAYKIDDKTEHYFVTERLNPGILPQILDESLKYRDQVKKEMSLAKKQNQMELSVQLNGKQLAIKVTGNSIYGLTGSSVRGKLPCAPIAASVTAIGRSMIFDTQKLVESKFSEQGAEVIYGDSVAKDMPVFVKFQEKENVGQFIEIQDLFAKFMEAAETNDVTEKEIINIHNIRVWSDKGWTQMVKIIRHKTKKRMFRIVTGMGLVDVTEDHSLLLKTGEEVRPVDVKIGTELLHNPLPNQSWNDFQHSSVTLQNKVKAARWCRMNDVYDLELTNDGILRISREQKMNRRRIRQIIDLGVCDDYVYDLETENHHFNAGIGSICVHNTDSIFVKLNKLPTEEKDVAVWFDFGHKMAKVATQHFGKKINLDMEKMYQPLLMYPVKKRYAGVKKEYEKDPGIIDYRGIELKKSDSTQFVKDTYKDMLNALLKEKSVVNSIKVLQTKLKLLQKGEVKYEDFVLSKNLRPECEYKNKNTIQLVVAKKMKERDVASAPSGGDKIRYIIAKHADPRTSITEKAVDLVYAKEKKMELDLEYYLEHQLLNPITQLLEAFVEKPDSLFDETRRILQNKRTKQMSLECFGVKPVNPMSKEDSLVKNLKRTTLNLANSEDREQKSGKEKVNPKQTTKSKKKTNAVQTVNSTLLKMVKVISKK
jgi:DNA polymerase elongation subunit (family B)